MSEYDKQADDFCEKHGIVVKAVFKGGVAPDWAAKNEDYGNRYRITIRRKQWENGIDFYYWGSISDRHEGKHPSNYDILACCSSDIGYHEYPTEDLVRELGSTCKQAAETIKHAEKLHAFFTEDEQTDLADIS